MNDRLPLDPATPSAVDAALTRALEKGEAGEQGHGPIGEQPRIGESFVWMRGDPGNWGEQIQQIVDVIGPASRDDDGNVTSWVVTWHEWDEPVEDARAERRETVVRREGNRWVRKYE